MHYALKGVFEEILAYSSLKSKTPITYLIDFTFIHFINQLYIYTNKYSKFYFSKIFLQN